jgi:hypothetical protein
MNTSTDTNQTHDTLIGFLRHCVAGAVLAIGFVAVGFGFAATAHADDAPPPPNIGTPAGIAPALIAPWIPTIDRYTGPWHVNCGFSGGHGAFQCSYG